MILDLTYMRAGKMAADIIGAGVEGGRNLSGFPQAANFTGGGIVAVRYSMIRPTTRTPDALRYLSRLGPYLNSGVNSITVPFLVDFITPVEGTGIPSALTESGILHSDTTTFSDTTTYSDPLVWGELYEDAETNAGTIQIKVWGGRDFAGGEWFSINHLLKEDRAYRISAVDDEEADGDAMIYTVGITPTLREDTAAGELLRFVRPRCKMRLAPGTSIPWDVQKWWEANAELSFIEAA